MQKLLIAFILFLTPSVAIAGDKTDLGPAIGSELPDAVWQEVFPAQGENGSVVFFVRSLDWCPYCKAQVVDVSASYDEFTARGLEVIYISYDSADLQSRFAEGQSIKGTFVSDTDSALIKTMGLLNESHEPGTRFYGIPHPAVFIVGTDATIEAKLFEEDWASNKRSYAERPTVDAILEAADASAE